MLVRMGGACWREVTDSAQIRSSCGEETATEPGNFFSDEARYRLNYVLLGGDGGGYGTVNPHNPRVVSLHERELQSPSTPPRQQQSRVRWRLTLRRQID
jgi:hypothetical protein